jgi:ribonuclease E
VQASGIGAEGNTGVSIEAQQGSLPDTGRTEQRPERSNRNAERGERGSRPERGERRPRGPRPEGDGTPNLDQASVNPRVDESTQTATEGAESVAPTELRNDGAPREKRPRDRYGRERKPRGERVERSDSGDVQTNLALGDTPQEDNAPRKSYFTQAATGADTAQVISEAPTHGQMEVSEPTMATQPDAQAAAVDQPTVDAPVAPVVSQISPAKAPASTVAASAPAPVPVPAVAKATPALGGMPKVQSFELPLGELAEVAQQSGLNWVNSDAAKVAAVQAAIAAEAKPVHTPRERPPVVQIEDQPLVLVETRRDLRNMTLPFEKTEQV